MAETEPRLGGPPGLFDSPNIDRESAGGIVQRVRVPETKKPELCFYPGRFQTNSLNDSDMDGCPGVPEEDPSKPSRESLDEGVAFKKSITGFDM